MFNSVNCIKSGQFLSPEMPQMYRRMSFRLCRQCVCTGPRRHGRFDEVYRVKFHFLSSVYQPLETRIRTSVIIKFYPYIVNF